MRNKLNVCVWIIGLLCITAAVTAETNCLEELLADVNGDCVIDITDLQFMGEQWLDVACTPPNCADLDQYEGVNFTDFSLLSSEWQKSAISDIVIH